MSSNHYINLCHELLDKYKEKWNWKLLSRNSQFPTDIKTIKKYEKYIDFNELGFNNNIKWNAELLQLYHEKFDFSILATKYQHKLVQNFLWVEIFSSWLNKERLELIFSKISGSNNFNW